MWDFYRAAKVFCLLTVTLKTIIRKKTHFLWLTIALGFQRTSKNELWRYVKEKRTTTSKYKLKTQKERWRTWQTINKFFLEMFQISVWKEKKISVWINFLTRHLQNKPCCRSRFLYAILQNFKNSVLSL